MLKKPQKMLWKPGTMLYPIPAVLVSCGEYGGAQNVLTVAWTGIVFEDTLMYMHDLETASFLGKSNTACAPIFASGPAGKRRHSRKEAGVIARQKDCSAINVLQNRNCTFFVFNFPCGGNRSIC